MDNYKLINIGICIGILGMITIIVITHEFML